jgi:hypothetical protein
MIQLRPLPRAISIIELYDRLVSRKIVFPVNFFLSQVLKLYRKSHLENSSLLPIRDFSKRVFFSGALRLYLHSLLSHFPFPLDGVSKIYSPFDTFISLLFSQFPEIADLFHQKTWTNSNFLIFDKLIQQKATREVIIEYTCQLCSLEMVLTCRGIKVEKKYLDHKEFFLNWTMWIFALFPLPLNSINDPSHDDTNSEFD